MSDDLTPAAVLQQTIQTLVAVVAWPVAGLWVTARSNDQVHHAKYEYVFGIILWAFGLVMVGLMVAEAATPAAAQSCDNADILFRVVSP